MGRDAAHFLAVVMGVLDVKLLLGRTGAYLFYMNLTLERLDCVELIPSILAFIRPPGTAVPDGLMFYRICIFFFATHSPRSLDRSP